MSYSRILDIALRANTLKTIDDILELGEEIEAGGPTESRQVYAEYERTLRMALLLLPKVANPDASLQQLEEEIQQPSDESARPQDIVRTAPDTLRTAQRVMRVIKARYEAFLQDSLLSDDAISLIAELIMGLDDRAGGAGDDDDDGEPAVKCEEGDCKVKVEDGEPAVKGEEGECKVKADDGEEGQ
ncbi:hypothetical protein BP00DRAFT_493593 [Aspergillus indologenus CBS 114.80]|uniref:Uncharacterized protein n=1 Tax=Aspergillus indologenus CBS 114.80 TaxID=1450541 RepID=A0A2V5ICG7_9EURO|nr:hypothetical protein BP00DRAFT_493593 [Aspergillus indologenus CBS 114.80]